MQKEPEPAKKLEFKEYPSIELSTRDKFIKLIHDEGHHNKDVLWVASQKIHGSNFSIHYSALQKIARYGRRNDFLTKEIPVPCQNPSEYFTQAFYDSRNLVGKYHNKLDTVFQNIKKFYPDALIIQIYGQYFGGNWPEKHPNFIKGPKAVQKGIVYTPNHEFFAFDIKITTKDSVFWADVSQIPNLLDNLIPSVPIHAKGTFEEMYAVDIKIDSTIPQILGLPKIQKNLIQGMVIRPNKNLSSIQYGQRIILKKKNAQFAQIVSEPKGGKKAQKQQKAMEPEVAAFVDLLVPYLNFNRIQSVVSKFPDLKDRNKLKIEIVQDILKDAVKDQYKVPQSAELQKKVRIEFDKLVMKQINSYYVKH